MWGGGQMQEAPGAPGRSGKAMSRELQAWLAALHLPGAAGQAQAVRGALEAEDILSLAELRDSAAEVMELEAVRGLTLGARKALDRALHALAVSGMTALQARRRAQELGLCGLGDAKTQELFEADLRCPLGHLLEEFVGGREFTCSVCSQVGKVTTSGRNCGRCDWEVCSDCLSGPRKVTPFSRPPLALAVLRGRDDEVALLLQAGLDCMGKGREGVTALHVAAAHGLLSAAGLLLGKGGWELLKMQGHKGGTALHVAAQEGQDAVVQALLAHAGGAELAAIRDGNGATCLHYAARKGQVGVLALLLGTPAGSELLRVQDTWGETCMHYAVKAKQPQAVSLLLEKDKAADFLNVQTKYGRWTCLHYAKRCLPDVYDTLQAAGGKDLEILMDRDGKTAREF